MYSYKIGTLVEDEQQNIGIVCIKWSDDTLQHHVEDNNHVGVYERGQFSSNGIQWQKPPKTGKP